jgi:hypothetical protein
MLWLQRLKGALAARWAIVWANRTKIAGYLGVIGGSVEMGIQGREHIGMIVLGASVAAIGHYNDRRRDS